MFINKREPSAIAHTPLMNVPVKAEVRSAIRPLSFSKLNFTGHLHDREELTSSSAAAPDPRHRNAETALQNVIVRRTEYNKLKDRSKDLEEQYRAISTSYSILNQDIKEVEAKNEGLEKRIQELEIRVEAERRNGLDYTRRELLLKAENEGLKRLLSQTGGRVSKRDDVVMDGGIE
jgi:septal ring factor EnvC (AmiA/AmiB activator)